MLAWLDAHPDDFRDAPHYSALRRLRQFAVDQLPDSDLHRRVAGRLAALRRQESAQRRPQSAGAQRCTSMHTSRSTSSACVLVILVTHSAFSMVWRLEREPFT